jgi:hypothetical protein
MLYHIHIDAETLDAAFAKYATESLGFAAFHFEPNPAGVPKFAPQYPFTLKLRDPAIFHSTFDQLERYHAANRGMKGYIEGEQVEYFKVDRSHASKEFDPEIPIPFKVSWRRLVPGVFRESELHITIPQSGMHPGARDKLLSMGFFLAVCKEGRRATAEIYTMQGSQQQIDVLRSMLIRFLEKLGGIPQVVLKEERIARWWTSSPDFPLPPVIDAIQTFTV